jgi:hypothetical protein
MGFRWNFADLRGRYHSLLWLVGAFLLTLPIVSPQYRSYTDKYAEVMLEEEANLKDEVLAGDTDLSTWNDPDSVLLPNDEFIFSFPLSEEYRIGVIVDPCRGHANYSCCMNVFGSPEYPSLKASTHSQERVLRYTELGAEDEVQMNYDLVYEDSSSVPTLAQRTPDDYEIHDEACEAYLTGSDGSELTYCQGKNYAYKKATLVPACMDNNQSLNTLNDCIDPLTGVNHTYCTQVAYSQNAFIGQCGIDDDHCGTYLEIHQSGGTPYSTQEDVIADVRVENRNVSGFYTTLMPLTWKGSSNKVLCAYTESFVRLGSMVYILPLMQYVPTCCCPKPFKPSTRVGSVQCPIGPAGGGAFGFVQKTLAQTLTVDTLVTGYPYCPIDLTSPIDRMMCSVRENRDRRHYVRNCSQVYQADPNVQRSFTSDDLDGEDYSEVCPYFDSCALTTDDGKCRFEDLVYTFQGRVGRVTAVDDSSLIPTVLVTFNDGRTSYLFNKDMVRLETYKSMYEMWWVLRTKSEFVVQKRKGFNVTEPGCTFDTVNNRYFPYAILDSDGNPLDSGTTLD